MEFATDVVLQEPGGEVRKGVTALHTVAVSMLSRK